MTFRTKVELTALLAAAAAATGAGGEAAAAGAPSGPEALKAAPVNTWVKVLEAKTGGRDQPVFVYAAEVRKFIAAAGMQHYGGVRPRHYDTEEFDLAKARWINAYPPGLEKGRPESGPVGDEYARQRAMHGHSGRKLFYKDGEHLRLGAGGQWHNGKTYGEYCYVPDLGKAGKVYVYMRKQHTLCYDVAARTWADLGAAPRAKCRLWGSMCYDPVNKEILHAGGDGGSADISTWVFDIKKNEWRKLEFGSDAFKKLFADAKKLRWVAKTLLGRCSSRHAVAETAAEAKVDLVADARKLAAAAEKLAAGVRAAGLAAGEKKAGEVAVGRLGKAIAALKAAGPKLSRKITPAKIAEVRSARAIFEQVLDALSPEPPGRARSQIAYDAANKKVVLFGGDGLDRTLSDTWLYDTKSRVWEQKFPAKCPAPRAGHILGWLPQAKRIVLAGGYSRVPLAQDIWTYDVAANEWKLLKHVPLAGGRRKASPGCPPVNARTRLTGAVGDGDVLVCFNGNTVWACKVDPRRADAAGSAARGAESGSYTWHGTSPAIWEHAAKPDAAKSGNFLKTLPVNQWTAFEFPKYAPGARNRWGSTAYDTDRHQLLFWGGGHATSHENDVAHFSVRGGFWTIGYHPDDPIERVYASQPTYLSFNDRVHVPIHAYKAYCYDPTAKLMFYFDRGYDPLVREWQPKPFPGLTHRGPMGSHMESTPGGAVTYSDRGLFRFDARAGTWRRLPWNGPAFGRIWCDGHALCYDSKRDCLWLANDKTLVRYDLAAGKATKLAVRKPKGLGKWILWGEQAYLPDADLVLLMRLFTKPDGKLGNVAWSPAENKFYWADLKFAAGGKPVVFKRNRFSWSDAMHYDPELKLVLLNNSSARRVWVMKFDRKTAKLEEMKD